jgi:hypothetical protein
MNPFDVIETEKKEWVAPFAERAKVAMWQWSCNHGLWRGSTPNRYQAERKARKFGGKIRPLLPGAPVDPSPKEF